MPIMDQIAGYLGIIKDVLGIPVVISNTISEGVSEGISDGISRNKKWIEQSAIKLTLFFISLFFFCSGLVTLGDNLFPQYKGFTAMTIGLILTVVILFVSRGSNNAKE